MHTLGGNNFGPGALSSTRSNEPISDDSAGEREEAEWLLRRQRGSSSQNFVEICSGLSPSFEGEGDLYGTGVTTTRGNAGTTAVTINWPCTHAPRQQQSAQSWTGLHVPAVTADWTAASHESRWPFDPCGSRSRSPTPLDPFANAPLGLSTPGHPSLSSRPSTATLAHPQGANDYPGCPWTPMNPDYPTTLADGSSWSLLYSDLQNDVGNFPHPKTPTNVWPVQQNHASLVDVWDPDYIEGNWGPLALITSEGSSEAGRTSSTIGYRPWDDEDYPLKVDWSDPDGQSGDRVQAFEVAHWSRVGSTTPFVDESRSSTAVNRFTTTKGHNVQFVTRDGWIQTIER